MGIVTLFTSAEGRIGRKPYFWGVLALNFIAYVLTTVLSTVYALNMDGATGYLVSLPFTVAFFFLGIKRAHDLGHSGWWLFGWIGAVAAGVTLLAGGAYMMFGKASFGSPTLIIGGVLLAAAFYQLGIRLVFFTGDDGANDYGPPGGAGAWHNSSGHGHSRRNSASNSNGGGNWMESALQSMEKEASTRGTPQGGGRTGPAQASFGRRNVRPAR